jgi:hypothetical protein
MVILAWNNKMCDTEVFKVHHQKVCANESRTDASACAGESQISIQFHSVAEVPWTAAK